MRSFILVLLSTLSLYSCSVKDDTDADFRAGTTQKWELISMSGSVANVPPATGDDMFWQEYYLFYTNGTFLKSREQNGSIKEATGTYKTQTLSDGNYLILSYKTGYELIGSCSSQENKEYLHFSNPQMSNTWNACDGPGLTYERVE
ncbi:hypothetical protein ACH3O9_04175 [Leeuwenhoekiella sp. A16]|uniref:hypothetical protein n=1 Tax=unclassified Leeuwenhoekiella TaxID=2615029 RepID=UPI003A802EE0